MVLKKQRRWDRLSTGGRPVDSRLQLNKRWCAVCMGFSGQLHPTPFISAQRLSERTVYISTIRLHGGYISISVFIYSYIYIYIYIYI
jgi:hypothetical protein